MSRTPRSEGGTSSLPSAPKKVVAILQRTVSWQRSRRGKGTSAATPQQGEPQQSPTLGPQQSGPSVPPPPPMLPPDEEEPRSPERPVELNERGVPLLTSLPEILEALESPAASRRKRGAKHLARLVDSSVGEQACLLGEYMREAGAVELLVVLLEDASIVQLVLMVRAATPCGAGCNPMWCRPQPMCRLQPFMPWAVTTFIPYCAGQP